MSSTLENVSWEGTSALFPGTRSTKPEDVLPWKCISEIIPGLFLTCEEELSDKRKAIENGVCLVISLCGEPHIPPYRVFELVTDDTRPAIRKLETLEEFAGELQQYAAHALPQSTVGRKAFVNTVPAQDIPNYDIGQHFPEMCALIELVLSNRARLGLDGTEEKLLPSVGVHCMVGVSRSASVVIAYLMKRAGVSRDDALSFVQSVRPVVCPNPGFQQQLLLWEATGCLRVVDELSASLVAKELQRSGRLVDGLCSLFPVILKSNKCTQERHLFGLVVAHAEPSDADVLEIYRQLRSYTTAAIDSEEYADVPNFFGYVCEVVYSFDKYVPQVLLHMRNGEDEILWSDLFYARMVSDLGRSGFEKDTYDTVRAFCSLMEAAHAKHLVVDGGAPRAFTTSLEEVPSRPDLAFSFPFLPFIAPYAEGYVQFTELEEFQRAIPTVGGPLTEDEVHTIADRLVTLFLRSFLSLSSSVNCDTSGPTSACASRWVSNLRLAFLKKDVEVLVFERLEGGEAPGSLSTLVESVLADETAASGVLICALRKVVAGAIAFRMLLEATEDFMVQAYAGRLVQDVALAERRFPVSALQVLMVYTEEACQRRLKRSAGLLPFFRSCLEPLHQCGVLCSSGAWSLLVPVPDEV